MGVEFETELERTIASFLEQIGIPVIPGKLSHETFLPGIEVETGKLIVDVDQLKYPGDLLHEAGHLAVMDASDRLSSHGQIETANEHPQVIEAAAICWSYAACFHLGIDLRVVFHDYGYHGRSEALLRGFDVGVFPGLGELEAAGMTYTPATAARLGVKPFPHMVKWLR